MNVRIKMQRMHHKAYASTIEKIEAEFHLLKATNFSHVMSLTLKIY